MTRTSFSLPRRFAAAVQRLLGVSAEPDEVRRARALISALDAGGLPLNPALVNQIARGLGLEVSSRAPMEQTTERIRAALARVDDR